MLRVHEARRVAHERAKELVEAAQEVCGDLNPDQGQRVESSAPELTTDGKMQALSQAVDSALDGLSMLREAEKHAVTPVDVSIHSNVVTTHAAP